MSRRTGVLATLASQWSRYVLQLLSLLILARLLTPADYGVVASVTAITGIAAVIGDFGLSLAALQAATLTLQQRSNLWWANSLIGCLTGLVVAAIGVPISSFYGRPELVAVCAGLALMFPLAGAAVQYSVELVRNRRFVALGVIEVSSSAVGLASAATAGVFGLGYWALVIQQVVTSLVVLVLLVVVVRWRPSLPRRRAGMRHFLAFGRDTALLQVVNYVSSNLDSVLIARFFGPTPLGLYNRAFQVVGVPVQQVAGPLTRVVLPSLSAHGDAESFNSALVSLQRLVALALLLPLSLCAALAAPLLTIVLGPRWASAAPLLQILAVGAGFQAIGFIYYWAFLARAATRTLFFSELWGRVLSVILMFVVIPAGPAAIAAAAAVGQVVIWICSAFIYSKRGGIDSGPLLRAAVPLLTALAASATVGALVATRIHDHAALQALAAAGGWAVMFGLSAVVSRPVRQGVTGGVHAARTMLGRRT